MPSVSATASVAGPDLQRAHLRARCAAGLRQVVVQAGQLDRAAHLRVHDLGADAAAAHQHATLDEIADGLSHRGPGHTEPVGELHLVLEAAADRQLTALDRSCSRVATWKYSGTGLDRSRATFGTSTPSSRLFRHRIPLP